MSVCLTNKDPVSLLSDRGDTREPSGLNGVGELTLYAADKTMWSLDE